MEELRDKKINYSDIHLLKVYYVSGAPDRTTWQVI